MWEPTTMKNLVSLNESKTKAEVLNGLHAINRFLGFCEYYNKLMFKHELVLFRARADNNNFQINAKENDVKIR